MSETIKRCCVCGIDVAGQKRIKDGEGHYYCHPCWNKAHSAPNATATGGSTAEIGSAGIAEQDSLGNLAEYAQNRPRVTPAPAASSGLSKSEQRIIGTGIFVALMILSAIIYFFVLRNRWENQNRETIIALRQTADTQLRQKRLPEAKATYERLLGIVGDHQTTDTALSQEISSARDSLGKVKSQIEANERAAREAREAEANAQEERREQMKQAREMAALRAFLLECAPFIGACHEYRQWDKTAQNAQTSGDLSRLFKAEDDLRQLGLNLFAPAKNVAAAHRKLPVGIEETAPSRVIVDVIAAAARDVIKVEDNHYDVWSNYRAINMAKLTGRPFQGNEQKALADHAALLRVLTESTVLVDQLYPDGLLKLAAPSQKQVAASIRAEVDRSIAAAKAKDAAEKEAAERREQEKTERERQRLQPATDALTRLATAAHNAAVHKLNAQAWTKKRGLYNSAGMTREEVNALGQEEKELQSGLQAVYAQQAITKEINQLPREDVRQALQLLKEDKSFDPALRPYLPDGW